jgi:hypothetical protein
MLSGDSKGIWYNKADGIGIMGLVLDRLGYRPRSIKLNPLFSVGTPAHFGVGKLSPFGLGAGYAFKSCCRQYSTCLVSQISKYGNLPFGREG